MREREEMERSDFIENIKFIKAFVEKNGPTYTNNIHNPEDAKLICHLFKKGSLHFDRYDQPNQTDKDPSSQLKPMTHPVDNITSNIVYQYIGWYHEFKEDYELAEKYYMLAVEGGNVSAMNNLGMFYTKIRKDYKLAEKYYTLAVESGNVSAMNNLGMFYKNIRKDYELAEKYYILAVESGCIVAMYNLGVFYKNIRGDYASAEKYYASAIHHEDIDAINNLGCLYYHSKEIKRCFEHCFQYRHLIKRDILLYSVKAIVETTYDENVQDKLGRLILPEEDELSPLLRNHLRLAQENLRLKNTKRIETLYSVIKRCKGYPHVPKELFYLIYDKL